MLLNSRPYRLLLAALLLCGLWPAAPLMAQGREQHDYVRGEVLLRLAPGADIRAVARRHRLKAPTSDAEQLDRRPIYRLGIEDNTTPSDKGAELAGDARVLYAEPNYLGQAPEARQRSSWAVGEGDGASVYQAQWAPEKLRLREAHAVTRGAGVTIAILDTGADLAHPALSGHLAEGYDFVDDDADPSEVGAAGVDIAFGHGTHVAGLLALAAPDARLLPLRTLGPDGVGTIWNQARALRFAVEQGAAVINLSWSFPERSRLLDDVLAEVTCTSDGGAACRGRRQPGAVVVAAAGNSGESAPEYPAASNLPGVMAVAASTQEDTIAPFSTYGAWVSLAAPGDRIVSSVPGGAYASWSGTSMATPLAASVVALLRVARPANRPSEIVTRLVTDGTRISGPVQRRIDAATVAGRRP
jgi:subtilisin family serine protease